MMSSHAARNILWLATSLERMRRRDAAAAPLTTVAFLRGQRIEPWWRWTAYLAAAIGADGLAGNLR